MSWLPTLVPMALAIITLGVGLSLRPANFVQLWRRPRPVLVALLCQIALAPLFAWGLLVLAGLPAPLAIGVMLIVASPGGPSANLFSHLAGGDVALNITLTALNTLTALVMVPLVVGASFAYFGEGAAQLPVQMERVVELIAVVLVPAGLGMGLRHRAPDLALGLEPLVRRLAGLFLFSVVALSVARDHAAIAASLGTLGPVLVLLNLGSLGLGYALPRWAGVSRQGAIATAMEVSVHNVPVAMGVAVNVLNRRELALPAVVYGVLMLLSAALAAGLFRRARGVD